jgi:DNA adenine methylase
VDKWCQVDKKNFMLTKYQKRVLNFIKSYSTKRGYAPSLEEIKKYLKISSVSTAHFHIKNLQKAGFLKKTKNQPRAIELNNKNSKKLLEIPLVGTITAGQPIEAIEDSREIITITDDIRQPEKLYALRVMGNSMIDEGIFDGDTVIIRRQNTADNGETVVAIIDDNEATLKKIYREKNRFRLQPANQSMLPFFRKEVEIRGVVVKITRDLDNSIKQHKTYLDLLLDDFGLTTNAVRKTNGTKLEEKPFVQWVGGKREMIEQYTKFLPKKFNTYYEPFLGGGAMFFNLKPEKSVLGDNNLELIKAYEGVRDNPSEVIGLLKILKLKHSKKLYLKMRNVDREINIFDDLNNFEIAARMIYLNQTCFNGLYRVNQKGQFNVPIGSSLNRLICDEGTINIDSKILKKTELKYGDFEDILKDAQKNDFIYLDPPYFPISKYSDFTRYTKEKFYKEDQVRLKEQIDKLIKKGCLVMLSNSDCDFIKKIYYKYNIHVVNSSRSLNCKKEKRGKVTELLITNY